MDAFSFPFRFSAGRAVTLDDASEQYAAQKVASIISTRTEELSLKPFFGTRDPEFSEFDVSGLYYTAALYFPEIQIGGIRLLNSNSGELLVEVAFRN
jgi:hypothetical protein